MTSGNKRNDNFLVAATAAASAAAVTAFSVYYFVAKPGGGIRLRESLALPQRATALLVSKLKSVVISMSGVERRLIVLLPEKENGGGYHHQEEGNKKSTLLVIFPGHSIEGSEYVEIGRAVQKLAASEDLPLVVGISTSLTSRSRLVSWALSPTVLTQMLYNKAERLVQADAASGLNRTSPVFQDLFIWGHSWGGFEAMKAALPSSTNGLILYGCSMSLFNTPQARPWPDLFQNNLLSSYPRPVLTMMGERDGFLRWPAIAGEAHTLHKDSQRRINSSQAQSTIKKELQKADELRKPVVVLTDLNHMHMAMGRVPAATAKTGRRDFVSPIESLSDAHKKLTRVVVDFLHTHSTTTTGAASASEIRPYWKNGNTKIKTQAEKRLLKQHDMTESLFLGPFSRLSDRVFVSQFLGQLQRKLLHITSNFERFHFYDESDQNEEEHAHTFNNLENAFSDKEPFTVITNWHQEYNDFVYSKPRWSLASNYLWLEATEQDPILIPSAHSAHIVYSQISNTFAVKGKSQEHVLQGNTKFQAIKDGPAPTLMQLNKVTFDEILYNVVTPQQRQRYKRYGRELRFGPDIFVWPPPRWVDTPISLTRYPPPDTQRDGEKSYYLLQSPYVATGHLDDLSSPFAGAWYGKPLSPAQCYEWIVFDAFKT